MAAAFGGDLTPLTRRCRPRGSRGHYELGVDARNRHLRVAAAFDELAQAM